MSELAWTARELADELHCCLSAVERLTAEGRIPHVRLTPRKVIYVKDEIRQWLADESHASTVLFELEADGAHTGLRHCEGAA